VVPAPPKHGSFNETCDRLLHSDQLGSLHTDIGYTDTTADVTVGHKRRRQ